MKEELLRKSLKRELSSSDLRTRLKVILGRSPSEYGLYQTFGATRLEDLLKIDMSELIKAEEEGKIKHLSSIRHSLHNYGCLLKGEYGELGISDEEALIPIKVLDISSRARNSLIRVGHISILGELLFTPHDKLINIRHLGTKSYDDIKTYVESLGYSLQKGSKTVEEIKDELRADGEVLVEDVVCSRKIWLLLNGAGIYTLNDLLGREIRSIPCIGETMERQIIDYLKEYCLKGVTDSSCVTLEKERELERLKQERDQLLIRRVALVIEQAEVDAQLREISASIKKMRVGGEYVRK